MRLKYHFNMRNVITLLFLIFSTTLLTQEESVIIYIDNSISIDRASTLSGEVSKVLDESNEVGFLILGSSSEAGLPRYELHDLGEEDLRNNLKSLCLKDNQPQRPQEIVRILSELLYNEQLVVIENNLQEQVAHIEMHFFFHISTFVHKKLFKEVVEVLVTDFKLIEGKTNVVIHLDSLNAKDHYNEYIDSIKFQSNNIKINLY